MRIAIAQINAHLGDFKRNRKKILEYTKRAKSHRCDIVVFPEAALFGYHPMDLLSREQAVKAELRELERLKHQIPHDMLIVFGAFTLNEDYLGKPFFNSAVVMMRNKILKMAHKQLLPTYDVFDDARHIEPGDIRENIINFKGHRILLTICEDIWAWPTKADYQKSYYAENPIKKIRRGSVDLVLNISASPFAKGKMDLRQHMVAHTVQHFKAPLIYVNMVGAQDELIFDGGSFAVDKKGHVIAQCQQFVEELKVVDFDRGLSTGLMHQERPLEQLRRALVLGIRDFVVKTGQTRVHLGLSGGIDSAVVACLAVDALGSQCVSGYALPGPFNSPQSEKLARKLAKNLNIQYKAISITRPYRALIMALEGALGKKKFDVANENIQARIRGLLLMGISNRAGSLLLNTSNKSELAAGFATLYGDMCGGLSPLGDLLKCDVYALAEHYNREHEIIPTKIITRAPSAELRKNQKDEDTLPPYNLLDVSVVRLVERMASARTAADRFLLPILFRSEFKRWQAPPILKVRERSFGRGRRMPIAHQAQY